MKLRRIHQETEGASGFTRWVRPVMENYIMVCCDCGLAHRLQFKVGRVSGGNVKGRYTLDLLPSTKYRVMFRAQRAPRYTRKERRISSRAPKEG